jgi:hypothetical protein
VVRPLNFITPVVAACIVTLVGCGDGRPALYPVKGVVRFESGDPVRNATIEFVPPSAGPSPRGRIDAEGGFVLGTYANGDGAPAGDYRVVVVQALAPEATKHLGNLGEAHTGHAGGVKVVALKHASPETSGVRSEVKASPMNDLEIVVGAR